MKLLPSFHTTQPDVVCKLTKSLYDIQEAPRQRFSNFLWLWENMGFSNLLWITPCLHWCTVKLFLPF